MSIQPTREEKTSSEIKIPSKKYDRPSSLQAGIIALNDIAIKKNNHILSHLRPYQAHTQDKLMSCLVHKTCTRQYIQKNREVIQSCVKWNKLPSLTLSSKFSFLALHSWCLPILH
jgi:hypothetical protein